MKEKENLFNFIKRTGLTVAFAFMAMIALAQVNGVVVDPNGEPVIGASVKVLGGSMGTVTDIGGNFTLNCPTTSTLEISYIGYQTQAVDLKGRSSVNIEMHEAANALSEVVVTGMGIKKDQKKLGYAVSSVTAEELVKTGAPNFATALYGKAAGVRIAAAPGGNVSAVSINIRGFSSITGTPSR